MEDKEKSFLLNSAAILFLGQIFNLGGLFVVRLILARELGTADFGVVSLGITIATFSSTIVLFGQHTGLGRYIPRLSDPDDIQDYIVSAFAISVPVSVLVSGVSTISIDFLSRLLSVENIIPILLFVWVIPLAAVMKLSIGVLQGYQNAKLKSILHDILLPGLLVLFVVPTTFLFESPSVAALAYLGAYLIVAIICVYYLYQSTPTFNSRSINYSVRELLRFSAPLTITLVMFQSLSHLDTMMIGVFASTSEVGIYSAVFPLTKLLVFIMGAFIFIFMPMFSEYHQNGDHEKMRDTYRTISEWATFLTLPVFLILVIYPEYLIDLFYGAAYTEGATALIILSSGFFIHVLSGPNRSAITAIGYTKYLMGFSVVVLTINVVLNLIFVPVLSYVGAAVATSISYVVWNVLLVYKLSSDDSIWPIKTIFLMKMIPTLATVPFIYWISQHSVGIMRIIIFATGFTTIHLLFNYLFGGNKTTQMYSEVEQYIRT